MKAYVYVLRALLAIVAAVCAIVIVDPTKAVKAQSQLTLPCRILSVNGTGSTATVTINLLDRSQTGFANGQGSGETISVKANQLTAIAGLTAGSACTVAVTSGTNSGASVAVAYATYQPSPAPIVTPNVTSGNAFYGHVGIGGDTCIPVPNATGGTAVWLDQWNPCAKAWDGSGDFPFVISMLNQGFFNTAGYSTKATSPQGAVAGGTYQAVAQNYNTGGQGYYALTINFATPAQMLAAYWEPEAPTHLWYPGCIARAGTAPGGIQNSDGSLNEMKLRNFIDSHCKMGRITPNVYVDDQTHNGQSAVTMDYDLPALTAYHAFNVKPYLEFHAGNVVYSGVQNSIFKNPTDFGNFVAHYLVLYKANFPQDGAGSNVLLGSCGPGNETNLYQGWDSSGTDDPNRYSDASGGQAEYINACYNAFKAGYPGAASKVYAGELANNIPGNNNTAANTLAKWYANAHTPLHVGAGFDGISYHASCAGDCDQSINASACYYSGYGFTLRCIRDMQAVAAASGDANLHVMISEFLIPAIASANNSTYGANNQYGQAYVVSSFFHAINQEQTIDGGVYASLDEDQTYYGTPFERDALTDTTTWAPYNFLLPGFNVYSAWAQNVSIASLSTNYAHLPNADATPTPLSTSVPTTIATANYTSNFPADTIGSIDSNWSNLGSATTVVYAPGNGLPNVMRSSPGGLTILNSAPYGTTQEVAYQYVYRGPGVGDVIPAFRITLDGSYDVLLDPRNNVAYWGAGGTSGSTAGSGQFYDGPYLGGTILNVRAQASGTTYSYKQWPAGTTEPTGWQWTVTDSHVTTAGYIAMASQGTSPDLIGVSYAGSGGATPSPAPTSTPAFPTFVQYNAGGSGNSALNSAPTNGNLVTALAFDGDSNSTTVQDSNGLSLTNRQSQVMGSEITNTLDYLVSGSPSASYINPTALVVLYELSHATLTGAEYSQNAVSSAGATLSPTTAFTGAAAGDSIECLAESVGLPTSLSSTNATFTSDLTYHDTSGGRYDYSWHGVVTATASTTVTENFSTSGGLSSIQCVDYH